MTVTSRWLCCSRALSFVSHGLVVFGFLLALVAGREQTGDRSSYFWFSRVCFVHVSFYRLSFLLLLTGRAFSITVFWCICSQMASSSAQVAFAACLCCLALSLSLSLPAAEAQVQEYVLTDNFEGSTFFSNFWFQTNDYNNCQGSANFTTQAQAEGNFFSIHKALFLYWVLLSFSGFFSCAFVFGHSLTACRLIGVRCCVLDRWNRYRSNAGLGLVSAADGQPAYMRVEDTQVYGSSGRPIVTIVSNNVYTGGLFVGDFQVPV